GSAGSVELPEVAKAAHAFEDLLIALRRAPTTTAAALPALETALDGLNALVAVAQAQVKPESLPTVTPDPPRADRRAVERVAPGGEQTVRVEVERIDELMDAASELVFDHTRIARRLVDLEARAQACKDDALGELVLQLRDDVERLRRTSATLQERI